MHSFMCSRLLHLQGSNYHQKGFTLIYKDGVICDLMWNYNTELTTRPFMSSNSHHLCKIWHKSSDLNSLLIGVNKKVNFSANLRVLRLCGNTSSPVMLFLGTAKC